MQYLGLAVVVALLALITALVALRLLLSGHWLLGWLRGTFGMLVLALGGLIGLIGWDISTYQPLERAGYADRFRTRFSTGEAFRTLSRGRTTGSGSTSSCRTQAKPGWDRFLGVVAGLPMCAADS
jgi:hypothetical protein